MSKKRKRFSGTVGIEASNCRPQKHQITQHICMQQQEALQTCANFNEFGRTSNDINRISGKFPQATIRTFASLASRGGGSPLRRCGPWQLFVGDVGIEIRKPPFFLGIVEINHFMWIPKINNSCISKAHLANPQKSPGFHRSAVFRQTEWPLRCLPCASWGARSWTGGEQENGSNEGRSFQPYEGIFTIDDTRSLLYLVQFGTSGTCVLPSMEVLN